MFGNTTAIATEQYPEVWVPNETVLGIFLSGLIIEFSGVFYVLKDEEVETVLKFSGLGDWVIYDTGGESGFLGKRLWELWRCTAALLDWRLLLVGHCLLVVWLL